MSTRFLRSRYVINSCILAGHTPKQQSGATIVRPVHAHSRRWPCQSFTSRVQPNVLRPCTLIWDRISLTQMRVHAVIRVPHYIFYLSGIMPAAGDKLWCIKHRSWDFLWVATGSHYFIGPCARKSRNRCLLTEYNCHTQPYFQRPSSWFYSRES